MSNKEHFQKQVSLVAKKKKRINLTKLKPKNKKGTLLRPQDSAALAIGAGLIIFTAIFLSFFTLTRASLAPVYAGTARVDSLTSEQTLTGQLTSLAKDYQFTLNYPDKSHKSFSLANAGLTVDAKQSARSMQAYLHHNLWERLAWWQPIQLEAKVAANKTKFDEFIASKATVVSQAPVDAVLSAPDGAPTITPEKAGSGYRVEQAGTTLTLAAAALDSHPLELKKTVLAPAITAKNLIGSEGKLEGVLSRSVTFNLAGHTITPSRADIADWIELTPVKNARTVDVTVNSGKIAAYIDDIADPYVRPPRDKLIMNTASGPLTLDYGGTGTDVSNKNEAATSAAKQLLKGEAVSVALTIQRAEAKTVELQPYDKLIVVDTSAKQLYAYEKTNLVRTVPVSAGAPNTPTVLGQYKIYSKRVSQDMKGANVDGSRYFQAAVPYVNYFYGSYAIHGNYWRPDSWFGSINSSHGCVGINDPDDAWVYNWAPIGTPVIVHV